MEFKDRQDEESEDRAAEAEASGRRQLTEGQRIQADMDQAIDELALEARTDLSPKQVEFLTLYSANAFMPLKHLAKQVGVKLSTVRIWMRDNDRFRMALQKEENRMQAATNMTRRYVMRGLLEAIDMARDQRKPAQMIAGWREVGRMCGFYEPERRELRISVESKEFLDNLRTLPRHKLLEMMNEEEVVDGEFEVIERS